MTPKEKAKQMYLLYSTILPDAVEIDKQIVKDCALMAVNDIIDALKDIVWHDDDYADFKINYWQDVKQEIKNL